MLLDGDEIDVHYRGQLWSISWHSPRESPLGDRHGSAGICITEDRKVILVSVDGEQWDIPAGRPEGDESWEETLLREMLEEACARVTDAQLLGFCRGTCIDGAEAGLILVRSIWLAKVQLLEWKAGFETHFRRVVSVIHAIEYLPSAFQSVWQRAFREAGLC